MTGEKKKEIWRVVKFVLFSASAGIIQIGLFTLLNELCKWSYWPCYLIALVASVVLLRRVHTPVNPSRQLAG